MAAGRERGYRDFNIKVGPDPDYDYALTSRVRELAPDAFLWTDANGGYSPEAAMRAAMMAARKAARKATWKSVVREAAGEEEVAAEEEVHGQLQMAKSSMAPPQ